MIYVVILLSVALLFLSIKLFAVKREMKRITRDLAQTKGTSMLSVDFVDADLQAMVREINGIYEAILRMQAENKDEKAMIRQSISMISHDMRTPLTSIIGYLQVAKKSENPSEVTQNIDVALDRAKYLSRLVNDFFEISLIESGQVNVNLEQVNLCEVICEEILSESPAIDQKGIEPVFLQADQNFFVSADKKMIARVIQNLTSNAVKYSSGKLQFNVESDKDGNVVAGIISSTTEKIETEKIFDRFYMADEARSKGGAGLGLYIVKCFVESMGGKVWATQDGEEFTISLALRSARNDV